MKIKDLKKIIENADGEADVMFEDDNGILFDCYAEIGWYVTTPDITNKKTCLKIEQEYA